MNELIKDMKETKRNTWKGTIDGSTIVYVCDWCSYEFERFVRRSGKKRVQSDAVVCPMCRNGLKTWS